MEHSLPKSLRKTSWLHCMTSTTYTTGTNGKFKHYPHCLSIPWATTNQSVESFIPCKGMYPTFSMENYTISNAEIQSDKKHSLVQKKSLPPQWKLNPNYPQDKNRSIKTSCIRWISPQIGRPNLFYSMEEGNSNWTTVLKIPSATTKQNNQNQNSMTDFGT